MDKIIPKVAWLTTNRTCNSKCKWCYTYNFNCESLIMDYNKIKETVDKLDEIGVKKVILIGGEPTINKNILEIIKYISNKKMVVSIASNGRKFSDEKFTKNCEKAGLNFVNISVKGINEIEYLEKTNSIGFSEMINGYKNLCNTKINTTLSYVITKNDKNEFEQLKEMMIKNNLPQMFFMLYKPSIDDEENYAVPSISELADACKTLYETFENSGISIKIEMSIPLCLLDENLLKKFLEKNIISTCCHITTGKGIVFDTDFNILPCNHFVDHPLNSQKIDVNDIVKFWNSEECDNFRKTIKTYPSMKCENCDKWSICGGGCILRWLNQDPNNII